MSFHAPKQYLKSHPTLGLGEGNDGFFSFVKDGIIFYCISSDQSGWEHVSVSLDRNRCPTWDEMCFVKSLFWDDDDCVIQFHPPKSDYVNIHKYVLHLWRPIGFEIKIPPKWMV